MGSKRKQKIVKQREFPSNSKKAITTENPDAYYSQKPAWNFASCDTKMWPFTKDHIGDLFWEEILPFLQNLEKMEWRDILLGAKNQNHSIDPESFNTKAQRRLEELHIEAESIISLRLNGTHRIYGYIVGRVFYILWFDENHGDNDSCVCRSHKKHT